MRRLISPLNAAPSPAAIPSQDRVFRACLETWAAAMPVIIAGTQP